MDGEDRSKDALDSAKTAGAVAASSAPEPSNAGSIAKIAVVMLALGSAVTYLLVSNQDVFVYSHMVNEVMHDPSAFADRTLRVEGDLVDGTVQFREDPCDYRFTIERAGERMNVDFPQCVVPDTFREGMGISVVVEGRLVEDGSFHATQVIPRCPSRYEMDQRSGRGETMPHGPGGAPAVAPLAPPIDPSPLGARAPS